VKLLGIETATELVGVAVADETGPRAAFWATGRRRHAETLAPAIEAVLALVGWELGELDAVVVDLGPGLFTGLRVGVATAKGLAQGLGVGVLGLSSLEVLAHAALDAGAARSVVSVVDARRGEVFAARFGPGLRVLSPAALYAPEALVAELTARHEAPSPVVAAGDGARRYAAVLSGVAGLEVAGPSLAGPPPGSLVALATERLAAGSVLVGAAEVAPMYLREADARINWVQRGRVEKRG
jgi:tRNA threonylcarbamoyladenosine biosynthesis protein TsaB